MPPISGIAGASSLGSSATIASVVIINEAIDDAEVVKQRVINYSGVGKINQNADDIPPLN
ncbi:hypothetical protein D210916BOD24_30900 [Alteromonas sp. D210916BOD_24]|uniref:hypothetical protein n=1 Tax=Alteromonas sp. D210916BOD_24 TaxID=3157618 RepID=UPI00399D083C